MRLYLAGPMTGRPNWNHPLFHYEANRLIEAGYSVENPALISTELPYHECLRKATQKLLLCEGIALMNDWRESRGALFEVYVAETVLMPVHPVEFWLEAATL